MKQLEVTILGQGYLLACPEGGEVMLAAAVASVDREMVAIRDAGKVKVRERIAVLAALNLAWQMAEREASAIAAPAAPAVPAVSAAPAAPAAPTTPAPAASPGGAGDVAKIDIDGLLQRIDTALGDDGQLL